MTIKHLIAGVVNTVFGGNMHKDKRDEMQIAGAGNIAAMVEHLKGILL